jgi:hypothetical protein
MGDGILMGMMFSRARVLFSLTLKSMSELHENEFREGRSFFIDERAFVQLCQSSIDMIQVKRFDKERTSGLSNLFHLLERVFHCLLAKFQAPDEVRTVR